MTIKTRNRLLVIFFSISLLILAANILQFIYASLNNGLILPKEPVRVFTPFTGKGIFGYNKYAVLSGIFALCVYVPAVAIIIYASFEKTQSIEVIYFSMFLLGCFFESLRLLIAEFELWSTYSKLLITLGKGIIGGRILAPLSLFFASIFSESNQRQNVENNLLVLVVISIALAVLYPLNTLQTTTTYSVLWGYNKLFVIFKIILFLSTICAMILNTTSENRKEMSSSLIGFILLFIGYLLLINTDCFFNLLSGSILLTTGTTMYLHSTHVLYMWN